MGSEEHAERLWATSSELLRARLPEGTWNTLFGSARAVGGDDHVLVLSVPSAVVKDRIVSRHQEILEQACAEADGGPVHVTLEVHTDSGYLPPAGAEAQPAGPAGSGASSLHPDDAPGAAPAGGGDSAERERRFPDSSLKPDYTFDAFVSGTSNRFALAAAIGVAEKPAQSFNPLFIYGDAGLGKTHLLHAIGNYVRRHYENLNVVYVSAESFTNDFIESIRTSAQFSFKQRYRRCDVLLIDDIQFLERRDGTREEFFHTFNTLHDENRQIVITSDRSPRSLSAIEDRLRSRFEWGLTTDVQPPDLETRLAILRRNAELQAVPVPGDVLEYIAANITDNIRELEGALIRVAAYASIHAVPVTLPLAEEQLRHLISAEARQVTPRMILEATADMFGLSIDDLVGKSRSRPLVTARQISMYVFRQVTDFSYPAIGREFGGRDHTTVIHAVEKISTLMQQKRSIYDQVTALTERLQHGA